VEVVFGEPGCVVVGGGVVADLPEDEQRDVEADHLSGLVEAEECVRRGEHRAHLREPGEERDGVDV
jgi:hypothetical protein